jgi:hypothetical protein
LALSTPYGAALFVAFAAEWFRRDRSGGAWDWIRPLGALNIRYDSQDRRRSDVSYSDVRAAVEVGLREWRRPVPTDSYWLFAVVREAGFPAAAVRHDPRLATWLKKSVLAVERGFLPRDAVGSEAWRASHGLVQMLFDAAVDLCSAIAGLRASLPTGPAGHDDPVAALDATRPGWRHDLPFDLESEDVKTLVEEVLRARLERTSTFGVTRRLHLRGSEWDARARVELNGEVAHQSLPTALRERLEPFGRVRLTPKGAFDEAARVVAAMERVKEEDKDVWDVRPLVQAFESPLSLTEDVRFGVLAGDRIVAEFTAVGGEALLGPAFVLEPPPGSEPVDARILTVLGASPIRSTRPWLVLAIGPTLAEQVTFEETLADMGVCSRTGHRLVAFAGRAVLVVGDDKIVWRAGADVEQKRQLVLMGETLRGVREQVFVGLPKIWFLDDGVYSSPDAGALRWRAHGHGPWRRIDEGRPFGRIDIAVRRNGELTGWTTAVVAPSALRLRGDTSPRRLTVDGLEGEAVAAGTLPVRREATAAIVDLERLAPGGDVRLEIRAEGTLTLSLTDPSTDTALITPDGVIAPRRAQVSIGRLAGYRLLAMGERRLCFELARPSKRSIYFTRKLDGEVPLSAFRDEIRNLLGGSDALDAKVWLSWFGASDRFAEIGWYDSDPDLDRDDGYGETTRLLALCLARPVAGLLPEVAKAPGETLADVLQARLGSGPWLVVRTRAGQVLRPRVLSKADDVPATEGLLAAVTKPTLEQRHEAFDRALASPYNFDAGDRRHLIDLLLLAKSHDLPLAALDAARGLCRSPGAAVRILAFCESSSERAAVLALQRDLSFLWSATALADWLDAFSARRIHVEERYAQIGIDPSEALRHISTALGEIADLQPSLAAHVRTTFLIEVQGRLSADKPPLDSLLLDRLSRSRSVSEDEALRQSAGDLVARHVDGDPPSAALDLARLVAGEALPTLYDARFADVVAAPYVMAAIAAGTPAEPEMLRRCREAWLYDPEYFETAAPLALARAVRRPPLAAMELAR